MSATLAPSVLSPNNPITPAAVEETFGKLGLKCPPGGLEDYTSLLTGIWEIWNKIEQMDDYVPPVDEERFPRTEVHRATAEENKTNAWAWKATVKDVKENDGLLAGKTVILKVRILLAAWGTVD